MGLKKWFANRWIRNEWKKIKEGDLRMISGILANLVKDIAEGKYGEGPKKLYWSLAGKKTWIAMGIAALYGVGQVAVSVLAACVPECGSPEALLQLEGILKWVPEVVAVLIAIGIYDGAVRLDPPKKD